MNDLIGVESQRLPNELTEPSATSSLTNLKPRSKNISNPSHIKSLASTYNKWCVPRVSEQVTQNVVASAGSGSIFLWHDSQLPGSFVAVCGTSHATVVRYEVQLRSHC